MSFALKNLEDDLEDVGSNFDGAPELEFRAAGTALGLEQSGLSYQRIPPGRRFPYGHTHKEQEEVYVVVRGSGRMKLDDEIVEVTEWGLELLITLVLGASGLAAGAAVAKKNKARHGRVTTAVT